MTSGRLADKLHIPLFADITQYGRPAPRSATKPLRRPTETAKIRRRRSGAVISGPICAASVFRCICARIAAPCGLTRVRSAATTQSHVRKPGCGERYAPMPVSLLGGSLVLTGADRLQTSTLVQNDNYRPVQCDKFSDSYFGRTKFLLKH